MAGSLLKTLFAIALVLVSGTLISAPAFAEGAKGGSRARETFTTFGLRKCSAWNKDMADEKSISRGFSSGIAAANDRNWLAGFVSGVNMALTDRTDLLSGMDLQTASDWVDSYCKENETADVAEAVARLYLELEKIHRQKEQQQKGDGGR